MSAPNLDCMDADDLWDFWNKHRRRSVAAELFPERPKGFVQAAQCLANYACNKAVAIRCRLAGKIREAKIYEDICDRIYNQLPTFARW